MSTTTYPSAAHTTGQAQAPSRVGAALRELATAFDHLLMALVATFGAPTAARAASAKRTQEATRTRRMADRWSRTDHRLAADLYCAADRHEANGE